MRMTTQNDELVYKEWLVWRRSQQHPSLMAQVEASLLTVRAAMTQSSGTTIEEPADALQMISLVGLDKPKEIFKGAELEFIACL